MIVVGLVLGRWWRTTLILAAVLWPVLAWGAIQQGPGAHPTNVVLASGLGVANAAVGVGIHQVVLWAVRMALRVRRGGRNHSENGGGAVETTRKFGEGRAKPLGKR